MSDQPAPQDDQPETAPPALRHEQDHELDVIVMGMHRSGTSAIAGLLHAAGMSAGASAELMPARQENPMFFGERETVMGLNDRLLSSLGWTWDAPAVVPSTSVPDLEGSVAEGRQLVWSIHASGVSLIKDPRISLLLPWWRRILLDRFVAVVPIRSPDEVAWSLAVRNGYPFELGLALWAAYHRHLVAGLDGLPAVVVDYAALTRDPVSVATAIIAELRRLGVTSPLDADAASAAVRPALRRITQPSASSGVVTDILRIAEAWTPGPVTGYERFSMPADGHAHDGPAGWEVAILELHRRTTHLQAALEASRRDAHASVVALGAADADRAQLQRELDRSALEREEANRVRSLQAAASARTVSGRLRRTGAAMLRRMHFEGGLRRRRNPLFDASWYLARNGDVLDSGVDPYRHYRRYGVAEGRDPNAFFRVTWYLDHNPDVRTSGVDPLDHYLRHGAGEGRDPSPSFSTTWYLEQNPDVSKSGLNPLLHFLRRGQDEGRQPTGAPGP